MKVFVTGATGLIGAHTALELLNAGHEVRLLVRNKQMAVDYFAEHGLDLTDIVVGDMLDKGTVKKGMQGCDAIAHIAGVVDLSAKNAETTKSTNLKGIDSVIGSACELGIEKILYVSSMSIFFDPGQKILNEESPLADVKEGYALSKKMCELRIRELQEQGKPIISTYPSGVFGPHDPKMAESNSAIVTFVNTIMPLTSSGMQFVDARDVALAHRLLLESDLSDDKTLERYVVGGYFKPWKLFADRIEEAAGTKLKRVVVPGQVFRALGWCYDALRHVMVIDFPISRESMTIVTQLPPAESHKLIEKTGMTFRPPLETLSETIQWMRDTNKIK